METKSARSVRNGEIEFWRLIFSIAVVFYHCKLFLPPERNIMEFFPRGSIAVEYFFILSGFLMAKGAEKRASCSSGESGFIGRETTKYMLYRFRSIFRYMVPAMVLLLVDLVVNSSGGGSS